MKSPRPPAILHRHTHAIVGCRHRARTPCHQIRVGALRLDTRQRRTPERTVLYRVLADNLETLLPQQSRTQRRQRRAPRVPGPRRPGRLSDAPALRRTRAPRVPRLWDPGPRLLPRPLHRVRQGRPRRVLLQGPRLANAAPLSPPTEATVHKDFATRLRRVLPLLRYPPHGRHCRLARRPRAPRGTRAPTGTRSSMLGRARGSSPYPTASATSAPTTPPPAPASAASSSAPSRPPTSDALVTRPSPIPASDASPSRSASTRRSG